MDGGAVVFFVSFVIIVGWTLLEVRPTNDLDVIDLQTK